MPRQARLDAPRTLHHVIDRGEGSCKAADLPGGPHGAVPGKL